MTARPPAPRADLAGAGLIVLAAVCFATLGPLSRFADDAGVDSLTLVTWRAALGATVMTIFIGARLAAGIARPVRLRDVPPRDRRFMIGAAAANAILNFSVFVAFTRISIALALLVFYLYPALVAVISVAWFGERIDRLRWTALAVSLTGLVLVLAGAAGGIGQVDALGIGLAFVGGIAQAFYVLAARHGFSHVPGPQAAALTMSGALVVYLVVAAVSGSVAALAAPVASAQALWPVLMAGIIGAGVPTVAYIIGIRMLGPSRAAILAMLEPVVGVLLAAWLLAEQPSVVQLVGGALILVAAVLLQLRPRAAAADHEAVAG
ncbi:MAG TPA: DMT family transporter [Candidatus Binatia bacterium]|nr:DMT family transporter [Candidatus Binatia bacterium]